MRHLLMTTILALSAGPLWADDLALVLGNERYDRFERILQADDVARGALALSRMGVQVFSATNADIDDMREQAQDYLERWSDADTQIITLSGRFATDGDRSWFLGRDAVNPSMFGIGQSALSVETMLGLLAKSPGQGVLILGYDDGETGPLDVNIRQGIGALDIPQGVTVVHGRAGAVADLLERTVASADGDIIRAAQRNRRLSVAGYVPDTLSLFEGATDPATDTDADTRADLAAWETARGIDTLSAYARYLSAYPRGQFVEDAMEKSAEIRSEPNRAARLAEDSMTMNRDDKRSVQRDLNVLDFDTRGIDGIFGPGTRRAIANWQQQNGFPQTTYLTAEQITRIDAQAARRARQLEEAAERQRAAEEARDRAYWEETGASRDEAGLRTYLGRYPDGKYSDIAERRLAEIEEAKRDRARGQDREAWDRARSRNTVAAYRDYLRGNRDGSFRDEATARIARLERDDSDAPAREAAEQAENSLRLDPLTRRLIEARLDQLGLEPGQVDGEFNNATRRAIRRYQRDRNLDRTGFLNQATVSRLLRDGLR